ncbi:MAG: hypothetical protein P1P84_18440 [Deferrisomatales bacterium]|nr:hypothetical protein [Deferrisomatales bacterium]
METKTWTFSDWKTTLTALAKRRRGSAPRSHGQKLGTFLGVFTPTVLTILGVIMYLRFGWVVGHMGLPRTLMIVVMANAITLITTLSLSAVATNSRVGVGGAYFIISRSLGLEVGGAIGLPLFLSQALSVTLYSYGLAESLRFVWAGVPVPVAAFVIVLGVAALAFRGAESALRSQVPIMALIGLSLVALLVGALFRGSFTNLADLAPSGSVTFWAAFAVFFPAVTGIMAGLGLSGDLEDPRTAIPFGTMTAMLVGFAVYLLIPVLLAFGAAPESLRTDTLVWTRIAPLGALFILPGLWGAIFSSAVGSMLGAPRTLQAMAQDHLAPRFLAGRAAKGKGPVHGLGVSLAIALAAVLLGDLNTVAVVVTMFFLTVYGTVNLVAAVESLSGSPSWRPKVGVHWAVSLAGALGCFGVMVLIHPLASAAAVTIELLLWFGLRRKERQADWGDVREGMYEAILRWALVRLSRRPLTARNWRPHILVFVERMERRLELVRYGDWLSQRRGVVTVCELLVGDLFEVEIDPLARQEEMNSLLKAEGIVAFGEVDVVAELEDGIVSVAQANGMGALESNTVMLGLPEDVDRLAEVLRVIRRLEHMHKSLLIGRVTPLQVLRQGRHRAIHVWWGGLQRNGDLMLLLAYLLTRNPEWRDAEIRVLSVASNELMQEKTEVFLHKLLPEIRIQAQVEVVQKRAGQSIPELILEKSGGADLVLLGLAIPEAGGEREYAQRLFELAEGLASFFFVRNASLFIGELVTPDSDAGSDKVPLPAASPAPTEGEATQ